MKKLETEKINFDDGWVDKSMPMISISQVLGMLQEPFDSKGVAEKTYANHFNNPDSQYYQKTVDQILEMWSAKGAASREYGSMLDEYIGAVLTGTDTDIELYKLNYDFDNDPRLQGLVASFDDFITMVESTTSLVFVDRERTVYYKRDGYYVKGRFDALFYDTATDTYVIIDWKSSDSIDTVPNKWTKKLLGAARTIDDLNGNTYTMQLHFYKLALLHHYLPEGTDPDKVNVTIVNLPGHSFPDGKRYKTYTENLIYNEDTLNKIFDFGYKKNLLMSKMK